jgi:hypothetical protein
MLQDLKQLKLENQKREMDSDASNAKETEKVAIKLPNEQQADTIDSVGPIQFQGRRNLSPSLHRPRAEKSSRDASQISSHIEISADGHKDKTFDYNDGVFKRLKRSGTDKNI